MCFLIFLGPNEYLHGQRMITMYLLFTLVLGAQKLQKQKWNFFKKRPVYQRERVVEAPSPLKIVRTDIFCDQNFLLDQNGFLDQHFLILKLKLGPTLFMGPKTCLGPKCFSGSIF